MLAQLQLPDLFDAPSIAHDPGGKVKTKLPPHIIGDAFFYGASDEYRVWLSRYWGTLRQRSIELAGGFCAPHAILIGMNPSTADKDANDPTIKREIDFVQSWGLHCLVKFNVSDYRATHPSDLNRPGLIPVSEQNLPTLLQFTKNPACQIIVVCCGNVPKILRPHLDRTVHALREQGLRLQCFGLTKEGFPRHPLYLKGNTPLIPF